MDWPWWFTLYMLFVAGSIFGLPAVGFGFFLQGLMRLRIALLVSVGLFLMLPVLVLIMRGAMRTWQMMPTFLALLAVSVPLVGFGWLIGIWDEKRKAPRKPLVLKNGN
jgi:hypothetical protein